MRRNDLASSISVRGRWHVNGYWFKEYYEKQFMQILDFNQNKRR